MKKKQYLAYLTIGVILITTAGVVYAKESGIMGSSRKADSIKEESFLDVKVPEIDEDKDEEDNAAEEILDVVQEKTDSSDTEEAVLTVVANKYPIHKDITATYFWAGEEAGKSNKEISNLSSAWDEKWVKHFGGVDNPKKRNGFFPAAFTPKENPFYFALPYNDFNKNGTIKTEILQLADWTKGVELKEGQSYCKNRWAKITKGGKVTYAQWEDVGPFGESDKNYVFGTAAPKSKTNSNAGIDVSPAVRDFLGLKDVDKVDWQFIDESLVPDGPWKRVVTTSQVYWK